MSGPCVPRERGAETIADASAVPGREHVPWARDTEGRSDDRGRWLAPRPLRGFGPFACTRRARSLHCVLHTVRRGHVIRVDYVAFTATTTTRTRAAARRAPEGGRL